MLIIIGGNDGHAVSSWRGEANPRLGGKECVLSCRQADIRANAAAASHVRT